MSSSASRFYYQLVLNNLEVSLDTMYMNTFICSFPPPTHQHPPPLPPNKKPWPLAVLRLYNIIHWINLYPVDTKVLFTIG